jgi:hypothetical protein
VDLLIETAVNANRVEHCQDLKDCFGKITGMREDRLIQLDKSPDEIVTILEKYETEPDDMLDSGQPLAARGTPVRNTTNSSCLGKTTHSFR